MFEKHARKGRLVYVAGKLQTRRWKKEEENSERFSTEILLALGGRVQFLDKPNGNGNGNGAHTGGGGARRRSGRRHSVLSVSWAGASRVGLFFCSRPRGNALAGRREG